MSAVVSAGSSPLAYRMSGLFRKKKRSESHSKTNIRTAPTETQPSPETGDSVLLALEASFQTVTGSL